MIEPRAAQTGWHLAGDAVDYASLIAQDHHGHQRQRCLDLQCCPDRAWSFVKGNAAMPMVGKRLAGDAGRPPQGTS
jgi:hypothetical protein